MSDFGAMILMENGNPFVTPQSTPFCLYGKVVVNSVANGAYHGASATVALDASYPVMVFIKTTNTAQPTTVGATRSGGNILVGSSNAYGQSHTLTAYVFAIFPQTLPAWGFAIWDASGKLVLTNESRVLSDLQTVGTPGASGGINIDVTLQGSYAVAPAILGSQIVQNNNTRPPTIVNITAYAGCRFNGSSTRINAAPSTTATGSAAGGTTTGIALTAINTAAYD
ncbi:hypothetical protein L358_00025 [Enterobacter sp. MGH 12]|uniref:hypothetical protein n=1 Tax=Enterobacter sp. MGH 12 TaxID=1329821 RepID=UPI00044A2A9B|nr:hypothetical protein [Enterobacter sp. MGH 12]EUM69466.1 hypothetical protein L358_00025 [Enterobacter sp. MGH 12]